MKNVKFDLKIFLIDKDYFELKNKNNKEIIDIISANHKKGLRAGNEDFDVVKPTINNHSEEDFEFYTYCYNQPKNQNYWQLFLPDELGENQDFNVIEFSYVLFTIHKSNIYCSVGGSGFNVISTYIDNNFGVDLYQHFAKPSEDILLKVSSRGVAGSIFNDVAKST